MEKGLGLVVCPSFKVFCKDIGQREAGHRKDMRKCAKSKGLSME